MDLLTIDELSMLLKVKASWIRYQVFKREIPYIKVGRHIRFQPDEVNQWITRNRISRAL